MKRWIALLILLVSAPVAVRADILGSSDARPGSWEYLGSTSLSSAGVLTSTVTIPARDELMIVGRITGYGGGGDIASLVFNGDVTAADYQASHVNISNGSPTPALTRNDFTTGGDMQLGPTAITAGREIIVYCSNFATKNKVCNIFQQQESTAQATIAQMDVAYGEWFNTTNQITSVQMQTNAGGNMGSGSGFAVYGRNF